MPNTMTLDGTVASARSPASTAPMMPVVATITVLFAPASAWANASPSALRRARRSPVAASNGACATADISVSEREQIPAESRVLPAVPRFGYCTIRRSDVQRARMADHDRARVGGRARADLAERRFHLLDHEIGRASCRERVEVSGGAG